MRKICFVLLCFVLKKGWQSTEKCWAWQNLKRSLEWKTENQPFVAGLQQRNTALDNGISFQWKQTVNLM